MHLLLFRTIYYSFLKYVLLALIVGLSLLELTRVKPRTSQLAVCGLLVMLGAYTSTKIGTNVIIYIVLLSFFSKDTDIDRTIKTIFIVTASFFMVNFCCFIVNYFLNPGSLDTMPMLNGSNRYLLYYDHPNNAAREYIFLVCLYAYVYYRSLTSKNWIAAISGGVIVYYFTKSDAVWTLLVLYLIWLFRKKKKTELLMQKFVKYGIVVLSFFSFAFLWVGNIPVLNTLFTFLNLLATNRLTSNIKAYNMYGLTWFGQASKFGAEFEYLGKTYGWIYADNMYLYMIIHVGTVYLIALAVLFWFSAEKLNKRELLPVVAMLLFGAFENRVLSINVYFTVLLAVNALMNKKEAIDTQSYGTGGGGLG